MDFEWDEDKRLSNVRKHGIDFERAKEIWQGDVLETASTPEHHSEERYVAIGQTGGR